MFPETGPFLPNPQHHAYMPNGVNNYLLDNYQLDTKKLLTDDIKI